MEKEFKGMVKEQPIYNSKVDDRTNGNRIVVIADLHNYTNNPKRATALANKIYSLEPTTIFIVGDIFNTGRPWDGGDDYESFKNFVGLLSYVAPTCIIWGNHDIMGTNSKNFQRRLDNFKRLADVKKDYEVYPIYRSECDVYVSGMRIYGFVPSSEIMNGEGLKTQLHGIAHAEFLKEFKAFVQDKSVKFYPNDINLLLEHDPHAGIAGEGCLEYFDGIFAGHLHGGYESSYILSLINKIQARLLGIEKSMFYADRGLVEQPTGVVDRYGNLIKGSRRLLGPTNLCRGIVYYDSNGHQKFLQTSNDTFYRNIAESPNVQIWQPTFDKNANVCIMNELEEKEYKFILITEGVNPLLTSREIQATISVAVLRKAPRI